MFDDALTALPPHIKEALTTLPPSLKLAPMPYIRASAADLKALRAHFNKHTKAEFLTYLATNHAEALYTMGLNDAAIERMLNFGAFPENIRGQRLNTSIDHIQSLTLGGTNDFANLMLLPRYLNELKNNLETAQLTHEGIKGTLITIIPVAGNPVPYIAYGFERERRGN